MTEIDGATGRPVPTRVAHIIYLLHLLAPFTYWTLALVAVIVAWMHRDNVAGTYVESHYSWLLGTFWWGIFWVVLMTIVFVATVIGIFLLFIPWFVLTVWYLYRVVRGWMRLSDGKPAPA